MPKVLEFFRNFKKNGRYINVEITEKQDLSRQRSKVKKKSDGFKGRRNSTKGRSQRSSDFRRGPSSFRPRKSRRR